jgi:hypothetical protein
LEPPNTVGKGSFHLRRTPLPRQRFESLFVKSPEVFYLHIRGEQRGPYTIHHIDHLLNSGLIPEEALFWREGLEGWQPVTKLVVLRSKPKRRWIRPAALGVAALVLAIFLRIFGPITLDGWRESAQTQFSEKAAYWRARDFARQSAAAEGGVVQFFGIQKAQITLQPPGSAVAVVRGKLIQKRGGTREAGWEVSLGYDPRRKEWTSRGVREVSSGG